MGFMGLSQLPLLLYMYFAEYTIYVSGILSTNELVFLSHYVTVQVKKCLWRTMHSIPFLSFCANALVNISQKVNLIELIF